MHVCVEAEDSLGAALQERSAFFFQGFWVLNSPCLQQALTQLFSQAPNCFHYHKFIQVSEFLFEIVCFISWVYMKWSI